MRVAAARIGEHVRRTPVIKLDSVALGLPWTVTLKLELQQVTGSFKPRGAFNTLLSMRPDRYAAGVVTASGGNHGLGVAHAASRLGVPSRVFVSEATPIVKRERIAALGAEVVVHGAEYADAARAAVAESAVTGRPYLHAYATPEVIAGQGTVGLELVQDVREALDYVLVAVGGGGLIGGIGVAVSDMPWLTVVGIEPEGAATLHAALANRGPVDIERLDSYAADALGARRVGDLNYELAAKHVARVELVTDDDIRAAQRFLWERLQVLAEPGGAAALAGLLSGKARIPDGAHIAVIVCGGNTEKLP